jgi:heme-degrading monooxygenase HmoA
MLRLDEMDDRVTLRAQMEKHVAPVVLINKFTVAPEEADELVAAWTADAAFMKSQPGFVSAQLHRGIGDSSVFVNYAVWESTDAFARAFSQPAFRSSLAKYPPSTVASPHLFTKVAVPGISPG